MAEALIITDGRAGNLRQARALAEAMGLHAGEVQTDLRAPWSQLAPRLPRLAGLAQRGDSGLPTKPPWPRVVIGCGRQAAWATRWLRRRAGPARCFCIQILDPRIASHHWDLLVTPRHDRTQGDNVIRVLGSLNPVTAAWLAHARAEFTQLAELPRPRVALMIGGPRRGVRFDAPLRQALVDSVSAHLAQGGSALLCASPRTPRDFAQSLQQALAGHPSHVWLGDSDGPNPYPGHLAWADRILVTSDSVNMLSEAAASGVPVHTLSDSSLPTRLAAFHQGLREGGWLHDLTADADAPRQPLRETPEVGRQALERIRVHFGAHALIKPH